MKMGDPGYFEREAYRDRKSDCDSLGAVIKPRFNSMVVKLNQEYGIEADFKTNVAKSDIEALALRMMDEIDELKAKKSNNTVDNMLSGMQFLKKTAEGLADDNEAESLYKKELIRRKNETQAQQNQENEEETVRKRKYAKDVTAFYLALDHLETEGVHVPEGMRYTDDTRILSRLGYVIAQDKGLTLDDATPELRAVIVNEPKDVQDENIGVQYFGRLKSQYKEKIKDEDLKHIDYQTEKFNVGDIVKNMQAREKSNDLSQVIDAMKGKEYN